MTLKSCADGSRSLCWTKSSYSINSSDNDCVEAAATPTTVHVRDSKRVRGPRLGFPHTAWAQFVSHARAAG